MSHIRNGTSRILRKFFNAQLRLSNLREACGSILEILILPAGAVSEIMGVKDLPIKIGNGEKPRWVAFELRNNYFLFLHALLFLLHVRRETGKE